MLCCCLIHLRCTWKHATRGQGQSLRAHSQCWQSSYQVSKLFHHHFAAQCTLALHTLLPAICAESVCWDRVVWGVQAADGCMPTSQGEWCPGHNTSHGPDCNSGGQWPESWLLYRPIVRPDQVLLVTVTHHVSVGLNSKGGNWPSKRQSAKWPAVKCPAVKCPLHSSTAQPNCTAQFTAQLYCLVVVPKCTVQLYCPIVLPHCTAHLYFICIASPSKHSTTVHCASSACLLVPHWLHD